MADKNNKNNKNNKNKPVDNASSAPTSRAAAYQTMHESTTRRDSPPEQCSPQNRHRGCRLSIFQRCVNSTCDCTAGCRRLGCGTCSPSSAAAAVMSRKSAAASDGSASSAPRSMSMDMSLRGGIPVGAAAKGKSAAGPKGTSAAEAKPTSAAEAKATSAAEAKPISAAEAKAKSAAEAKPISAAEAKATSAAASAAGASLSGTSSAPTPYSIAMRGSPSAHSVSATLAASAAALASAEAAALAARWTWQGSVSAASASPSPPPIHERTTESAPAGIGRGHLSPAYVSLGSKSPEEAPAPPRLQDPRKTAPSPPRSRATSAEENAGRDPFWTSPEMSESERGLRVDAAVAALRQRQASLTQAPGPNPGVQLPAAATARQPSPESRPIKRVKGKTSLKQMDKRSSSSKSDRSIATSTQTPFRMGIERSERSTSESRLLGSFETTEDQTEAQSATAQRRRRHSGSHPSQRRPGTPRHPRGGASFSTEPSKTQSPPSTRDRRMGDYSPVVDRRVVRTPVSNPMSLSRSAAANPLAARSNPPVSTGLPNDSSLRTQIDPLIIESSRPTSHPGPNPAPPQQRRASSIAAYMNFPDDPSLGLHIDSPAATALTTGPNFSSVSPSASAFQVGNNTPPRRLGGSSPSSSMGPSAPRTAASSSGAHTGPADNLSLRLQIDSPAAASSSASGARAGGNPSPPRRGGASFSSSFPATGPPAANNVSSSPSSTVAVASSSSSSSLSSSSSRAQNNPPPASSTTARLMSPPSAAAPSRLRSELSESKSLSPRSESVARTPRA
jgi:trimeric autotransporter adhesin